MSTTFVPVWSPRLDWFAAPPALRDWVAGQLGQPVVAARGHTGGFSAGIASTVYAADGSSAFVKAVHADLNPFAPDSQRREILVNRALPAGIPAPRLRAAFDDDGWVALLFDAVDGAAPQWPWRADQLAVTVAATHALHDRLTPTAVSDALPDAAQRLAVDRGACRRLADQQPAGIDGWTARHLGTLVDLVDRVELAGSTVLNLDVRADNVVIDRAGQAWIVDWSWGCVGAAFLEALPLLLNAAVAGHDPQIWLADSTAADASPDQIDGVLALLIGMWAEAVLRPEPVGTAGLRNFQRSHLGAAQDWLQRRRALC
jgi:hypothetical protein